MSPDALPGTLHGGADLPRPGRVAELVESLVDPLWYAICSGKKAQRLVVVFRDGELLCREGDQSYHAFVLLRGVVRVSREGKIATEQREGTFLGEVTALTGGRRTATLQASGEVWVLLLNSALLERFVQEHPAAAMRLIKSLAIRYTAALGSPPSGEVRV